MGVIRFRRDALKLGCASRILVGLVKKREQNCNCEQRLRSRRLINGRDVDWGTSDNLEGIIYLASLKGVPPARLREPNQEGGLGLARSSACPDRD